ncbi:MAG: hypothetical protein M1825_000132 [Sarcosagium campestre]|nr:MAG: hypothetical protein M1825_000132 [Sarcosagium campestre]
MALPPEVAASYAAIIDGILATVDLTKISSKRIRQGLQAAVEYDLTPQKDQIKDLILERFYKFNAERATSPSSPAVEAEEARNGYANGKSASAVKREPAQEASPPTSGARNDEEEDDDMSDTVTVEGSKQRKKKRKIEAVDDDALYAARLQAEENNRARPTRGGAAKKASPLKKKRKAKSKSKTSIGADDDSDIGSGSGEKKRKVNRSGGFHKQLALSAPLAHFMSESTVCLLLLPFSFHDPPALGHTCCGMKDMKRRALTRFEFQLSRPETVKRIWAYVKEHDLQDPKDKRQIRCDDALKAVFKQDRIHMFTMNKVLSHHLFAQDE